jgi:hypothetical protein
MPGPQQVRQQERHDQKLKEIKEQVAQGTLVIRKMTTEERAQFPPREPDPSRRRRSSYRV